MTALIYKRHSSPHRKCKNKDTTYKNKLWTALGYEDGDDEKSLSDLEKEYKESQGSHPKNDMMIEVAKDYIGDQAKVSDGETTNE